MGRTPLCSRASSAMQFKRLATSKFSLSRGAGNIVKSSTQFKQHRTKSNPADKAAVKEFALIVTVWPVLKHAQTNMVRQEFVRCKNDVLFTKDLFFLSNHNLCHMILAYH